MKDNKKQNKEQLKEQNNNNETNECPIKDEDGNCLVPGVYNDSDPIGGGG